MNIILYYIVICYTYAVTPKLILGFIKVFLLSNVCKKFFFLKNIINYYDYCIYKDKVVYNKYTYNIKYSYGIHLKIDLS